MILEAPVTLFHMKKFNPENLKLFRNYTLKNSEKNEKKNKFVFLIKNSEVLVRQNNSKIEILSDSESSYDAVLYEKVKLQKYGTLAMLHVKKCAEKGENQSF